MTLEFYQGWAQNPNSTPIVSGAGSGNAYQVAYRLLVSGGQWTAISSYDGVGYKFPMSITLPQYLGEFKAYQVLISADGGLNWRLAYTGVDRTLALQSYDSSWVITNPNRTITPGLSLLDFGSFSASISPSLTVFAKASSNTPALKVGARRASGQTVPELFGKLYVEYVGKYTGIVGSGLPDISAASSATYDHPYLSSNLLDLNLAAGDIAAIRISLIAYDSSTPISTTDPVQLNLEAGVVTYPLPLAPIQASKGLLYQELPIYTATGLTLTIKPFKLARFGAVISAPGGDVILPPSSSTSVYVGANGSLTLSPTGFSLGRFTTSSTSVTNFTPEIQWLPDKISAGTAGSSVLFGQILSTNFSPSSGSSFSGIALHSALLGNRVEVASEGAVWIKTTATFAIGDSVFIGASGEAAISGASRIGYTLSATISGYVVVQLDRVSAGGGASGSVNLSVDNRTATSLDITSDAGSDATVPEASTSLAGLLSAADKAKIDAAALTTSNNTYTKAQIISAASATVSGTISLDWTASNVFNITLSGNASLTNPSALAVGATYTLMLRLGGNTITLGSGYKFASTAPTLAGNVLLGLVASSSTEFWVAGYVQGF